MAKRKPNGVKTEGVVIDTDYYAETHGKAPTAGQVGNWTFYTFKGGRWRWEGLSFADACDELHKKAAVNTGAGKYTLLP